MSQRYEKRGVSASKEEVHNAVARLDQGLFPNAFCKILPDYLSGDPERCTLVHADGAGTKSALAYAYWMETGDLSVWKGIAQDAIVMNVDDLLCVGNAGPYLLSSTLGRNKNRVPGEVISAIIEGSEEFLQNMRDLGIEAYHCGGETADVGDLVRTIIVDSTVTSSMDRNEVISNERIAPGDLIVGLASFGQASYEEEPNSGIGSNGLTSARHEMLSSELGEKYPETADPEMHEEVRYCGPYGLTDTLDALPLNVGKSLLSPTRTYAPVIRTALKEQRDAIHGMVHCSGGGQTKITNFTGDLHVVKDGLFEVPPLFKTIREASGTAPEEMYRVFNMGHRMELIVKDEEAARSIIDVANSFDIEARVIGRIEAPAEGKKLTIESEWGRFHY